MVHEVMDEKLKTQDYQADVVSQLTKEIAATIRDKLVKETPYERYKFIVNVMIGEQRGEGVKMACRCFWDADSDNYVTDTYQNVSTQRPLLLTGRGGGLKNTSICPVFVVPQKKIFCTTTVFAVYLC